MHMLKAASESDGKALNGLDFPRSTAGDFPLPFATDLAVWDQVLGEPWCHDAYPMSSMRWGLCATSGAYKIHRDCEGGCTFCGCKCGVKIWMVGIPRVKEQESFDDLAYVNVFADKDYDAWQTNEHLVDWVAVVLKPGSFL